MGLKKIIITLGMLGAFATVGTATAYAGSSNSNSNLNVSDIGNTTNIVTSHLGTINSVFTNDFRNSLQEESRGNIVYYRETEETTQFSNSRYQVTKSISSSLESKLKAKCIIDGVPLGGANYTNSSSEVTSNTTVSSLYGYYGFYYAGYKASINKGDFSTNINNYTNGYKKDLNKLKLNSNDYDTFKEFFDKYGTHVLSSVIYGAKTEVVSTFCSEHYTITSKQESSIKSSFEASMADFGLNSSYKIELSSDYDSDEVVEYYKTVFTQKGGSVGEYRIESNSLEKAVAYDLTNWKESIKDYSNLVSILPGSDGLLPLWEALPSEYESLEYTMKNMFKKYSEEYRINFEDIYDSLETGIVPRQKVRYKATTITDSGRLNQPYEKLDKNNVDGLLSTKDYLNAGYKKCKILIDLDFRNVDLGDQHFLLYSSRPTSDNLKNGLLKEWTRSINNEKWHDYSIEYEIDITNSSTLDSGLSLLYSASGKLGDDWKVDDVYVTYKFIE